MNLGTALKTAVVLSMVALSLQSPLQGVTAKADSEADATTTSRYRLPANPPVVGARRSGAVDGPVRLIQASTSSLLLEIDVPRPQFLPSTVDGRDCLDLHVDGFALTAVAGSPRLPVVGTWLGLPLQGEPQIETIDSELVALPGSYRLCPASGPVADPDGQPLALSDLRLPAYAARWDPQVYLRDALMPERTVELAEIGFIRSQRVGLLRFQPYQYNPHTGALRYTRRMQVRVNFDASGALPSGDAAGHPAEAEPFERLLQANLLNYTQARLWRSLPAGGLEQAPAAQFDYGESPYKISVSRDGMVQVTYHQLHSAGVPVDTLNPRTLRLFNRGSEVALWVAGESDGDFDSGDSVVFYGQKEETRWTATNVYWLSWGGVNGLRMDTRSGAPGAPLPTPTDFFETLHIEENHEYLTNRTTGAEKDHWFWQRLAATSSTPRTYQYTLHVPDPSVVAGDLTLRGNFYGIVGTPNHHTRILLNGVEVANLSWSSTGEYSFQTTAPQSLLLAGDNTLEINLPMDSNTVESFYLNRFELDYARSFLAEADRLDFTAPAGSHDFVIEDFGGSHVQVYDLSDTRRPVKINGIAVESQGGGEYRARFSQNLAAPTRFAAAAVPGLLAPDQIVPDDASSLQSPANGADYILITPDAFYAAAQPLAALRQSQGLRVQTVKLQDIYDEFSDGRVDPEAIRSFLAYAYANWQPPAPFYVLLFADGHFDPKNYLGNDDFNFIPPYLADVDFWLVETAADNRYVSVNGADHLPDMALGRLPVHTAAEATAAVAKIIAYEETPASGDWKRHLLFVADNEDDAGFFDDLSAAVVDDMVSPPYAADEVYFKENYQTEAATRQAILSAINSGRLIVSYVGHAATRFWAHENLFGVGDLGSLTNGSRLPLMLPMTCLDGYFIWPNTDDQANTAFAEALLKLPDKGSIAGFSPTGLGVASGHDTLERGFLSAFFDDLVPDIGTAALEAKLYLYAQTSDYIDLVEQYTLFGDPATRLAIARPDVVTNAIWRPAAGGAVAPLSEFYRLVFDIQFTNTGALAARQQVITVQLPPDIVPGSLQVQSSGATAVLRPGSSPPTWDVADLPPGASGEIQITFHIRPRLPLHYSVTAEATSIGELGTTANNTDTASTDLVNSLLPWILR